MCCPKSGHDVFLSSGVSACIHVMLTLNPVLVIISLVFWGIPGAILSVPMLAITKIICDRVRPLAALAILSREG